jgi:hypothetical protein
MTAGRTTVSAVAAVLAAALLVVVLVTWAASIGPGGVLEGPGIQAERSSPIEPPPPESNAPPSESATPFTDNLPRPANDGGPAEAWIRAIAFVVLVATICLALFLLFLLARRLREAYDARGRRAERPEEVGFDVIEAPAVVAREILHDAEAQRLVLAAGPPGNAIVECWHRFETQAAAAGLSRQPWETSSEFTLRILELVAADDRAVFRLAGLYREARFSEHTMTEAHRAAALDALDVIHHGLRAPVSRGPA